MQRFFKDFESLNRFTLSLDCQADPLTCPHCMNPQQLVSHGVIYKQRSMHQREAVGKRVFCSNRYGHSGCGRTVQLYVAQAVPARRSGAAVLFAFLSLLLRDMTVVDAYRQATGQEAARQAWRWLTKLFRNLTDFRGLLNPRPTPLASGFSARCRRLRLLLPTVKQWFATLPHCPCAHYQLRQQRALM